MTVTDELTDLGRSLLEVVDQPKVRAESHVAPVLELREAYDPRSLDPHR